jgi:hypothetical protein
MKSRAPGMMRITALRLLAAAVMAMSGAASIAQAQTPEFMVVRESGPRDKRVNIVILGDGYTAAEKSKFLTHLKTVADVVVQDLPLTEYADYFNIYGIFVASNQSGADDPSQGIQRDTYFNASYSGRLLTVSGSKAFTVINKFVPEADMEFVVVNDDTYGGSGGQVAVASFAAPEIIAHEAQHSFSGLGDEYDYAGVTPWESPNTTKQTNRASIRWAHWIAPATPVPTPETSTWSKAPGLFEGAAYNATGWYRPKLNCRMRENGIPFCEPCSETIILSMYEKVSPMDSALPKPGPITVFANEIPPLRVKAKRPLGHALAVTWIVDGKPLASATAEKFGQTLAPGIHTVIGKVADTTHLVKKDPELRLIDSVTWQVTVSATTRLAALGDAARASLLSVDAEEAWVQTGTAGARLTLRTATGRLVDRRQASADASGLARVAWSHPLRPGTYILEFGTEDRMVRSRFRISP